MNKLQKLLLIKMQVMQIDRYFNYRTFGRCIYGDEFYREAGALISDEPLSAENGKHFLCIRIM